MRKKGDPTVYPRLNCRELHCNSQRMKNTTHPVMDSFNDLKVTFYYSQWAGDGPHDYILNYYTI